jgi:hypothetical protein
MARINRSADSLDGEKDKNFDVNQKQNQSMIKKYYSMY